MTTDKPLFSRYYHYLCKSIQQISIDSFRSKISENNPIVLIDIRSKEDWENGHIPNALHLDRGFLELKIESLVESTDTEIVLYCGGGTRSTLAAHTLQNMGYQKVRSLISGFSGWKKAELPISIPDEKELVN